MASTSGVNMIHARANSEKCFGGIQWFGYFGGKRFCYQTYLKLLKSNATKDISDQSHLITCHTRKELVGKRMNRLTTYGNCAYSTSSSSIKCLLSSEWDLDYLDL